MHRRTLTRWILTVAGLILLLALGFALSCYLIPVPQIAVIRIEGDIWGYYAVYLSQAMQEVEDDPAVRAVVLDVVSSGGEVTACEDLYFDVLKLREKKPVIASVNEIAASGAYYVASAADQIYAKAGSVVGNIGVVSILPDPDLVDEKLVTTGPFKLSGGSQVASLRRMEILKETFLAAILAQRELTVGPETLSRGEVYLGAQAQQMGLVDEIGSQGEAIAAAARMARVRHYRVMDRTPEPPEDLLLFGLKLKTGSTAATVAAPPEHLAPGFYYRYIEPLP